MIKVGCQGKDGHTAAGAAEDSVRGKLQLHHVSKRCTTFAWRPMLPTVMTATRRDIVTVSARGSTTEPSGVGDGAADGLKQRHLT